MGSEITLRVNGREQALAVEPRTLLVHALRDGCGLTGAKIGCDTSQCGACTVLIDGKALKSCTVLAVRAQGREITTVEGLGAGDALDGLQDAFMSEHGTQCGFCTPGMLMAAADLLARDGDPDEDAIRGALKGNICRCTGYTAIVRAVQVAARARV
jgi:aerobic carbon-monoxide dehydrogenase small subunit